MIFGKHINRYYLKYAWLLLLGLAALIAVDYMQLEIPELYQAIVNGMNRGFVTVDGVDLPFDMDFLLDVICMPMVWVIVFIVFGRFLWRICFFSSATRHSSMPSQTTIRGFSPRSAAVSRISSMVEYSFSPTYAAIP